MKRMEAEQEYGKQKGATELIDLTYNVAEATLLNLFYFYPHGITKDTLNLLYVKLDVQLPNKENMNIFYDKIFRALQANFTLSEIKILNKSNEDSINYFLMYKRLHNYFKEKVQDLGRSKLPKNLKITDNEIYEITFREMRDWSFDPHNPTASSFQVDSFRETLKRNNKSNEKIQNDIAFKG